MKKYLAITAALALTLTACGQAAADSTPTPTAATEAAAAPAEPCKMEHDVSDESFEKIKEHLKAKGEI